MARLRTMLTCASASLLVRPNAYGRFTESERRGEKEQEGRREGERKKRNEEEEKEKKGRNAEGCNGREETRRKVK